MILRHATHDLRRTPLLLSIVTILLFACKTSTSFLLTTQDDVLERGWPHHKSTPIRTERALALPDKNYIASIRSQNLAGAQSSRKDNQIIIDLQNGMTAITGETGSGKSLFVARALEVVTGGKGISAALLGSKNSEDAKVEEPVVVELELNLCGHYLKAAKAFLKTIGVDVPSTGMILLKRSLVVQQGRRVKSICHINNQQVTLKALTKFSRSMVTVVDASTAAAALSKPEARLAIIDSAVSPDLLAEVNEARRQYRRARRKREALERELKKRVLPSAFVQSDDDENVKLMNHWIQELGVFQDRVQLFRVRVVTSIEQITEVHDAILRFAESDWDNDDDGAMYEALMDFRDMIVSLDEQLVAAQNARDALTALSSDQSAITAIEKTRSFIMDSLGNGDHGKASTRTLQKATERSHELLNAVENALHVCSKFMEDDEKGLIRTIESLRENCPFSLEEIDSLLLDWSSLARKHGIIPSSLPTCHRSLKNERDGNVNARQLLPAAVEDEEAKLSSFLNVASKLTLERKQVADELTSSVTSRLPLVGMERSIFTASITPRGDAPNSDDTVEFLLLHRNADDEKKAAEGGRMNEIASSGEKARILLCVECELPGSVAASYAVARAKKEDETEAELDGLPPIAIVYDEIDAHVGGRAAVAMGSMLVEQSKWSQVIAITHSASIAAAADSHIVVQREYPAARKPSKKNTTVNAVSVENTARRKELARMASGDIAKDEAEAFAEALIREAMKAKHVN
jgi:DNA repair ATPase RecN